MWISMQYLTVQNNSTLLIHFQSLSPWKFVFFNSQKIKLPRIRLPIIRYVFPLVRWHPSIVLSTPSQQTPFQLHEIFYPIPCIRSRIVFCHSADPNGWIALFMWSNSSENFGTLHFAPTTVQFRTVSQFSSLGQHFTTLLAIHPQLLLAHLNRCEYLSQTIRISPQMRSLIARKLTERAGQTLLQLHIGLARQSVAQVSKMLKK